MLKGHVHFIFTKEEAGTSSFSPPVPRNDPNTEDFIRENGVEADLKAGSTTPIYVGSTLREIRDHLHETVPLLQVLSLS